MSLLANVVTLVVLDLLVVLLVAHAAHRDGDAHATQSLHGLLDRLDKACMLTVMLLGAANCHARLRRGGRDIRYSQNALRIFYTHIMPVR